MIYLILIKIISLIIVVTACIYATYTDVRYRKISNKLTYSLISIAILINLIYLIIGEESIIIFTRNFIITLIASFIMYYTGLWSPGDSKLFLAVAILIPIDYFKYYLMPSYPSLAILINSFIPGFISLVLFILIKTSLKQKLKSMKRTFNMKFLLEFLLTYFIFFSAGTVIINLLFRVTNIVQNFFFIITVYILFFYVLDNYVPQKYHRLIYSFFFIVAIINIIVMFKVSEYISLKEYIFSFVISFFLFLIFRFFFLDLSKFVFIKEKNIKEVREGDVPVEMIFKSEDGYYKSEIGYFSLISQIRKTSKNKEIIGHRPEGLSRNDIRLIKKVSLSGCFNTLKIQKSIHFALFILIGVLISLLARGNFILFLLYR
jgi:preflagellin peptidase FlaK